MSRSSSSSSSFGSSSSSSSGRSSSKRSTSQRSVAPRKGKSGSLVPEDSRAYRALATAWLRYDRSCHLVCFERSPWDTKALPDVLGLDKLRRLIEIEIKVSKADFLKDAEKPHRKTLLTRIMGKMTTAPQELWYLVPRWLAPTVFEFGPEYAGILVPSDTAFDPHSGLPILEVHRQALRLHSFKLPIPQTLVMAKDMAGTLASVTRDYVRLMGEVVDRTLVVPPTAEHSMDITHRRVPIQAPQDTSLFSAVNPAPVISSQQFPHEAPRHDDLRKSWSNIGQPRSSGFRPTAGETRSPG